MDRDPRPRGDGTLGHPGNCAAMSPVPGEHHPSPLSSQHPGCHVPFLPPSSAHATAEAIPNIPIPNLPSPSSQDPQPSLLPPHRWLQAGCSHSLFAQFGCFTNNGVGRDGEGKGIQTASAQVKSSGAREVHFSRAGQDTGGLWDGVGTMLGPPPTPLTPQPHPGV